MASKGRGRRVSGRNNNPPPPAFDQQAFMEAISVATATIAQARASAAITTTAQASVTVSQGGPSYLQRFKAHHPPTFKGGGDPMVANHWFR